MSKIPYSILIHTIKMMNAMSVVLTDMERNGCAIDMEALDVLENKTQEELDTLTIAIDEEVVRITGGMGINIGSSEQLSELIYSRKVKDKKVWASIFNIGTEVHNSTKKKKRITYYTDKQVAMIIKEQTEVFMQHKPTHCNICRGFGKFKWLKKDGTEAAKRKVCMRCFGKGFTLTPLNKVAGLQCKPLQSSWATSGGFGTGKDILQELAERETNDKTKTFLKNLVRHNALTSYLSTTINGIRRAIGTDGILHSNFNQTVTSTGRLSSTNPNLTNQPRGYTFPIRRVFVSRWEGGAITKGDFSGLEFRVAVELSKDEVGAQDLKDGVDAHERTRMVLESHGQVGSRQDAKTYTFKPLYGGTTGTTAQRAYFKFFFERYAGILSWHETLLQNALTNKYIVIPSGRIYRFPFTKRYPSGGVSQATQIKNYPVQGFATADIVPIVTIEMWRQMKEKNLKSIIINEVHDEIDIDTHPNELDIIPKLLYNVMMMTKELLFHWYKYELTLELPVEIEQGPNWLDVKEVKL